MGDVSHLQRDYQLLHPALTRMPAALRSHVDWLIGSVTSAPHTWADAWGQRLESTGRVDDHAWLGEWEEARRSAWWVSLAAAKQRRRGKIWSALGALFAYSTLPEMPTNNGMWAGDIEAAAIDAGGDAVAALVAYDEAVDFLTAEPDAVRFLMDSGNTTALLMYPAVLVKHGEKR